MKRNLGLYGEIKFAEQIRSKGFDAFFPYRDRGVDIVAVRFNRNGKTVKTYQVKSRNRSKPFGTYWFQLKKKDIQKNQAQYWVFAIFIENNRFDFFCVPFKTLNAWIQQSRQNRNRNILSPDSGNWWLKVDRNDKGYVGVPKKGSIKPNKYLFS